MSINNVPANAPESMKDWVQEVEKIIADLQTTVATLSTQN